MPNDILAANVRPNDDGRMPTASDRLDDRDIDHGAMIRRGRKADQVASAESHCHSVLNVSRRVRGEVLRVALSHQQ